MNDWLTSDGATRLAKRIEREWRKRGHEVTTRVETERVAEGSAGNLHCIRSDMINGYPRSWGVK